METKKLIEDIVKLLVDEPEAVVVEQLDGSSTSVINIKVAKGELGKVLGKKGRIINALRIVFGSIFAKDSIKAIIEIGD